MPICSWPTPLTGQNMRLGHNKEDRDRSPPAAHGRSCVRPPPPSVCSPRGRTEHRSGPLRVAMAYTEDSVWRNRDTFIHGREEIV